MRPGRLHHVAVIERDGAAADVPHQFAVVRRDEHGRAAGVDVTEQVHDLEREIRIEVAGGFIGQDERRLVDQRPRDRDALLLAAAELQGVRVHPVLEAQPLEHLEGPALLLHRRGAQHAGHEPDVVQHGLRRDQLEVLEDEADGAPVGLRLARRQLRQVPPRDFHRPFRRQLLPQQEPKQRRLAGAAGPGEEDEFSLFDDERHIPQGVDPAAVHLREVRRFNHGSLAMCRSRPRTGSVGQMGRV